MAGYNGSIGYPQEGMQKGTVISGGSTYAVWEHQQADQPFIEGTRPLGKIFLSAQAPGAPIIAILSPIEGRFNARGAAG